GRGAVPTLGIWSGVAEGKSSPTKTHREGAGGGSLAVKGEGTSCGKRNELANQLRTAAERRADETTDGRTVSTLYSGSITSFVVRLCDITMSEHYQGQRRCRHNSDSHSGPLSSLHWM